MAQPPANPITQAITSAPVVARRPGSQSYPGNPSLPGPPIGGIPGGSPAGYICGIQEQAELAQQFMNRQFTDPRVFTGAGSIDIDSLLRNVGNRKVNGRYCV